MKSKLIVILFLSIGFAPAYAGNAPTPFHRSPYKKSHCHYDAGFEFGIYGAGLISDGTGLDFDDAVGGGISLGYYFNETIGLDLGAAFFSTDREVQNYTLDLVYREQYNRECFAPYVFIGAGVHTDSETASIFRGGVGIDFRVSGNTSVFADGAYSFAGDDVEDYVIVRAGLRFAF